MNTPENLNSLFEPALMEEIEASGELRSFKDGEIVIDYGKYIRMMPLVIKGSLKVLKRDENGNEILLYYLSSNETCSMAYSCCLEEKKSEIKAIAEGDLEIIAIPHHKLDEWLIKYPGWKKFILRSFNDRFYELLKSIESIAFLNLDERLLAYLKEKSRLSGSNVIKASHNQIAEDLATSRVVISRLLKIMENKGRILLYRNEIKLL
ncbi:Crp/Fnr family transcriptional regulator [Chitinophaga silvisoli]|uniref:Crp/Fnr family transcriptional regulator n=1 Tax=Chitinophaga silvisoli TaxID=2291814 RepID=A0A3E1NNK8_9BACT|nr:Crp/Fnr family transcriptional regulator [Chitinophaga silvisoli]RFM29378.1 Crp/Fnr family transcriptional regulator [Chitinophaga silvisoli]